MEGALFLRSMGGLLVVLGLLSAALWLVKRYDLRLPGRVGGGRAARLAVVERLALDARRSLVLIRRDGTEHLVLLAPDGVYPIGGATPVVGTPLPVAPRPRRPRAAEIVPFPDPLPGRRGKTPGAAPGDAHPASRPETGPGGAPTDDGRPR